jgi:hypothetical protein
MNDETALRMRELHEFRRTLNEAVNQLDADLVHVESELRDGLINLYGADLVLVAVYDLFVDKCKALIDEPA